MLHPVRLPVLALAGSLLMAAFAPVAHADSPDELGRGKATGEAKLASGAGNIIYLAAGTILPLLEDGKEGTQHSMRTADSLLTSTLLAEALKRITREKRPDSSDRTSFPSGHATAAFAVATMESHYHPNQALLWYGGAMLIGASRVQLNRHRWHDVAAGAAIGYFTSRFELSRPRGLLLAPFIHSREEGGGMGIGVVKTF
jgi:PAP2 superfamily